MDANTQAQVIQVQKFIDDLVNQRFAGQEGITPEVKEELKKEALERMNTFIIECTLDEFADEDVELFAKMVEEKKSAAEIDAFARSRIPDYEEFMKEVLEEFREIYLEE